MKQPLLSLIAIVCVQGVYLQAHDVWLSASPWQAGPQTKNVIITANVGETFPVITDRATPAGVESWRVVGPDGPVTGQAFRQQGRSIATLFAVSAPGAYLGILLTKPQITIMKGQEFTDHLREEGLQGIIAERAKSGQANTIARERYARFAKVVVRKGEGSGLHVTRPANLKAELVPATDPSTITPGQSLVVRFLVDGKPVEGVVLTAQSEKRAALNERTDAGGRATFVVSHGGPWLIRTVHMARARRAPRITWDWESYGVSLAFSALARP
jgi:uncharacterized GH25 family protein